MKPDSPVFPGDFSVQGNLGISLPYIPLPMLSAMPEPGSHMDAVPCPGSLFPKQQGREKDKLGHTYTALQCAGSRRGSA